MSKVINGIVRFRTILNLAASESRAQERETRSPGPLSLQLHLGPFLFSLAFAKTLKMTKNGSSLLY